MFGYGYSPVPQWTPPPVAQVMPSYVSPWSPPGVHSPTPPPVMGYNPPGVTMPPHYNVPGYTPPGVVIPPHQNVPGYTPPGVTIPPHQNVPGYTPPPVAQQPTDSVSIGDWRDKQLIGGVKAGEINREEFMALGMHRVDTAKLAGMMGADGSLSAEERQYLASRDRQYDRLYQQYKYGDYYPRTQRNDSQQQQMLQQMSRMWTGLKFGDITRGEGNFLLNEVQSISAKRGQFMADGVVTPDENRVINNGLNVHKQNVDLAINNSVRDGYWSDNTGLW